MIVEGQVHGGIAQGVGQALLEGAVYDKSGQLITASFMDYAMPRADDLPSFNISHHDAMSEQSARHQGCGEAGAIGSTPAVINAITDAIGTTTRNAGLAVAGMACDSSTAGRRVRRHDHVRDKLSSRSSVENALDLFKKGRTRSILPAARLCSR
jgi:xanthine dehydrogenase molybdopterin-binding subunit B